MSRSSAYSATTIWRPAQPRSISTRRSSRSSARRTCSTATTVPGMDFSITTCRCTGSRQPWMVGTRWTRSSVSTWRKGMLALRRGVVVVLGAVAAVLSACTALVPTPAAPTPAPPIHIKVGDQMFAPLAPVYVAFDRGYFTAEGLDVELVPMPDPTQVVVLLSSGQLTFGCIGGDPALFNAMARGINVRLLAAAVSNGPTDRPAAFIMRPDLLDGGRYKNPGDLKGMTFAVPGPQGKFYINRLLTQGGLTDNDVTYVQLSLPDMLPALQNKAIDGAW